MTIAVDISPLNSGHYLQHRVRGTGFYLQNLKSSLPKYYPENKYVFFNREDRLKNVDVVHYPYFEPFFLTLPLISKNKFIVTVHDLTPFVFPNHFKAGIKGALKWQIQKIALKSSNAIITDSISSKNDIMRFTGIERSKINVIYLAAGEDFKVINAADSEIENLRKKYKLPQKFVLYVGDVTWNKNLPRLVKAMIKINIPLVMIGGALVNGDADLKNPWNSGLAQVIKLAGENNNIIRLGFVSNEELVQFYNLATVFAMPSLYEGFGLPILEAMNCGCPVITSKEGSIPEIAGDAAFFVDAYDIDNIGRGIEEVFNNEALQKNLSDKGIKQSKMFTWKKTAKETMAVYQKFASK